LSVNFDDSYSSMRLSHHVVSRASQSTVQLTCKLRKNKMIKQASRTTTITRY